MGSRVRAGGGRLRLTPARRIAGVGIDTERADALAGADAAALARFEHRWLSPAERRWCRQQPDERRAVVACVAAKEAAWKATAGAASLERIVVIGRRGPRRRLRLAGLAVALKWRGTERGVLVTAIATSPGTARA